MYKWSGFPHELHSHIGVICGETSFPSSSPELPTVPMSVGMLSIRVTLSVFLA